MYKLILALVVAVFVGGPAGADISSGPIGGLVMVDSTEKLVGGLVEVRGAASGIVGFILPTNETWVSTIDTPEGAGFVSVSGDHLRFDWGHVYFSTPDCTGPAYAQAFYLSPGIDGGFGLIVDPNQHLYAATGPPIEPLTQILSSSKTAGNCSFESANWTNMVPVTDVGDLSAEFAFPMSFQTATTHYASLPFSLWWLLGGVLLGFGIKNAVKKS